MGIIVVSGTSGVGKSTLIKYAVSNLSNITNLIPVTSRLPRVGERDGVDRYFSTMQDMQKLEQEGKLCMINEVYYQKYGYYTKDFQGTNTKFIELHHRFLHQLDNICPNYISICIEPSDICITKHILLERKTLEEENSTRIDSLSADEDEIRKLKDCGFFQYIFVNDYDEHSKTRFLNLIKNILGRLQNEQTSR